jgi:hypothetical protein
MTGRRAAWTIKLVVSAGMMVRVARAATRPKVTGNQRGFAEASKKGAAAALEKQMPKARGAFEAGPGEAVDAWGGLDGIAAQRLLF